MSLVRVATERLLLSLFWIARSAFLTQGLAMGTALLAVPVASRQGAPLWLEIAFRSSLLIGATLFGAGVLLAVARRLPGPGVDAEAEPTWPWLLGLSLALLPALTYPRASGLIALWQEILDLLQAIGFWEELQRSNSYSGIVLLPILVALFVPALETAAGFFLIAVPLCLIPLLATRSRLFPRIFAMLVVCQAGLVLASLLAADAFSRLAAEAIALMNAAEDVEVHRAAEALGRARGVLTTTAAAFVAPLLGHLIWLPALLLSRRVAAFFTAGASEATARSRLAAPLEPERPRPTVSVPEPPLAPHGPTAKPGGGASERRVRVALLALGSLMLAFAASESSKPRAAYVSSDPAPGATLAAPPTAVRVRFDRALDPSSSLSVTHAATPGGEATPVTSSSALDPDDPRRSILKAELSGTSAGLYRVAWRSLPAAGGIGRNGAFTFGVGMPVAESVTRSEPLEGRDAGERGRRHTLAGGVILLALGALLPWLPRRS